MQCPPQQCYPPQHAAAPYLPSPVYGGQVYNSGGNVNHSGMQTNGSIEVGNSHAKSGGVDIGTIGGNLGNQGGQQVTGDVTLGNIGCGPSPC